VARSEDDEETAQGAGSRSGARRPGANREPAGRAGEAKSEKEAHGAKVAFAKLYDRKTPITAADLINDRVVLFYDAP
jgi:hypothetical protein